MYRVLLALALTITAFGQVGRAPAGKKAAPKKAPAGAEQAAASQVFPIVSINITGSQLYKEADIIRMLGIKVGDPGGEKVFEKAQQVLTSHGAFSSVAYRYQPSGNGYAVTFEVTDAEQMLPMKFDERLKVDEKAVRAKLATLDPLFRNKIPGTNEVMERYRKVVQEVAKQDVQVKVGSEDNNDLFVLFYPKNTPPVVAGTFFQGNKLLGNAELQNTLNGVAVGVEYTEKRLRELIDNNIRPMYEARGRVGVKFPKIEATPDANVRGLKILVTVEEGPTYSFGDVAVTGVPGGEQELAKLTGIKPEEVANMQLAKEAQEKIHAAVRRNGHMNVKSTISRQVDDNKKVVNVTYRVVPGPIYTYGNLYMKGLDLHGEHEIKRLWNMKPGQPFNADYPDYFLTRIKEEQIFENLRSTRVVLTPNHEGLTVDVTLVFNEKKPELLKPTFR
ncbi:MAG: hypothetical protein IT168_01160 [Bryobacterales bacterium]|nr:hypothetical protein [Bryobacterales bacterium]